MKKGAVLMISTILFACGISWGQNASWFAEPGGGTAQSEPKISILDKERDPYGYPRPGRGEQNVPIHTSFYMHLGIIEPKGAAPIKGMARDQVDPDTVVIQLEAEGRESLVMLSETQKFAKGFRGNVHRTARPFSGEPALGIYLEGDEPLLPSTRYTVHVSARSDKGLELAGADGQWRFTTEAPTEAALPVAMEVDLRKEPVRWHGSFFAGLYKPSFCTSDLYGMKDTFELMQKPTRHGKPDWQLQRDLAITAMDWVGGQCRMAKMPNVVRELETRRIKEMTKSKDGIVLHVEDFFGHEQYGIPSGRPVSADYHPGDEILITGSAFFDDDGYYPKPAGYPRPVPKAKMAFEAVGNARAKVLAVDDANQTVLVTSFPTPKGGWTIDYFEPLPLKEDPRAPGLFPPGGCYLKKFNPVGTPHYYWGRLDHEWDLCRIREGFRPIVDFHEAPGDTSIDGGNWTRPKDYKQYHEVIQTITSHLIERYGDDCLRFYWAVFNEPDLSSLFWRPNDWGELMRFYDYTVDAVLRAFEDHGYDSSKVTVGGLELAAVRPDALRLDEFLVHCSPTAEGKTPMRENAVFADPQMNGKRSKRVEKLCEANGGKGSPCDYISVHSYCNAANAVKKITNAKMIALQIDPAYYEKLYVCSYEACPDWMPPADPAVEDSYLGNGFYVTWTTDIIQSLIEKAASDPRYGYGESVPTIWPWPAANFGGLSGMTRAIHLDDDGDNLADRVETIPVPVFNLLNLIHGMSKDYYSIPAREIAGQKVGGFVSRSDTDLRVVLSAHNNLDPQSRSDIAFEAVVDLRGLPWEEVEVTQYRFDKRNNTYYDLGRDLRDRNDSSRGVSFFGQFGMVGVVQMLESSLPEIQKASLDALEKMRGGAELAVLPLKAFAATTADTGMRRQAEKILEGIQKRKGDVYTREEFERVKDLAELRPTKVTMEKADANGNLSLKLDLAGNGVNYAVVEPK